MGMHAHWIDANNNPTPSPTVIPAVIPPVYIHVCDNTSRVLGVVL